MAGGRIERLDALANALAQRGVLRLREAAALLGVSEMTVRRDVAASSDRFAYLGGHIVSASDIAVSSGYVLDREADSHARAKAAACAAAARLIGDDETIFVDCGTTLIHLAARIPDDVRVTAICYSLNTAEVLSRKPNVTMILIGGVYHPASASFASVDGLEALGRLGINKAFISAGGVDGERGVSCSHFHEVPIKQKAITGATERHLVVDSSKLGKVRPAYFATLDTFDTVITENGVSEASRLPQVVGDEAAPPGP